MKTNNNFNFFESNASLFLGCFHYYFKYVSICKFIIRTLTSIKISTMYIGKTA